MAEPKKLHPAFRHRQYLFRRWVFNVYGGAFHVYDGNGNLAFYSKRKVSKVKTEFRVYPGHRSGAYSDGIQEEEFLTIKASSIVDTGATHNVHDTTTDKAVGAIRQKAVKSIIKDEWVLLSNDGEEIGRLTERNVSGALFGRFIRSITGIIPLIGDINLIPKRYVIVSANDREVAQIRQHFNPLVVKYSMTIVELEQSIDRRFLIAAGILLAGL